MIASRWQTLTQQLLRISGPTRRVIRIDELGRISGACAACLALTLDGVMTALNAGDQPSGGPASVRNPQAWLRLN